jgi:hypothetical protein
MMPRRRHTRAHNTAGAINTQRRLNTELIHTEHQAADDHPRSTNRHPIAPNTPDTAPTADHSLDNTKPPPYDPPPF